MGHPLKGTHPIDIATEAMALPLPPVAGFSVPIAEEPPLTAYEEIVGRSPGLHVAKPRTVGDERSAYLPYALGWQRDPRQKDVQRGLGGLGLIKAVGEDLGVMSEPSAAAYSAALLNYDELLGGRSGVLSPEAVDEGGPLERHYPGVSGEWAVRYANTLKGLRAVFRGTTLFEAATAVKDAEPKLVKSLRDRQKHKIGQAIEIHTNRTGQLVVVQVSPGHQVRSVA